MDRVAELYLGGMPLEQIIDRMRQTTQDTLKPDQARIVGFLKF